MNVTEPSKAVLKDTGEFIIVGDEENKVIPIARMTLGVAKGLAVNIMNQINSYEKITGQKILAPQEMAGMYKDYEAHNRENQQTALKEKAENDKLKNDKVVDIGKKSGK